MGPTRLRLSKPVIAAVEGHAVAGGLELALWCDLRVVAEDAVLGVFCRRWGVPLVDGGTVRLPRLIGLGRALDLILTGRPVGAREAHTMGLADRVVAPGTARTAAEALAAELAALPQECLRQDRRSALEGMDLPLDAAMTNELAHGRRSLAAGAREGAARFAAGHGAPRPARRGQPGRLSSPSPTNCTPPVTRISSFASTSRRLFAPISTPWSIAARPSPRWVRR
jgi:enoyl-CoA hydratase